MLDDRALHNPLARRFVALMGALLILAASGLAAAAPATAADDDPVAWEWTDAGYWETTAQAGLPTPHLWLATTTGGGGSATFSAAPAGATTTALADLGLSVGNFNTTVVQVTGLVGDEVTPGEYTYTITATGSDASTAAMVLTITILPPLDVDGPPVFGGPTDWYISAPGIYDFYPPTTGSELASVTFPDEPWGSLWSFCNPSGSWWGGGPNDSGLRCRIDTLPTYGTYVFEIHASNDLGTTVFRGNVHIGEFSEPTIAAASEVKAAIGRAFPSFEPTLTGTPAPTVTIAPSGGNDVDLDELGLSLDPETGEITGTVSGAAPAGSYEYTLTATGAGSATHTFTIVTGFAPQVTGTTSVTGAPGDSLSDLVWTWTHAPGFTYTSVDASDLFPNGVDWTTVTVNFTAGIVSFTGVSLLASAELGTRDFPIFTISNEFGSTEVGFSLTVGEAPVIDGSTPSTIVATVGSAIPNFSPTTTGGTPASFSFMQTSGTSLGGALPAGLVFHPETGAITGAATDASQVGDYGFNIGAHNVFGDSAAYAITIRVGQAPTVTHAVRDFYVTRGASIPDGSIGFTGATTFSTPGAPGITSYLGGGVIHVSAAGINYVNLVVRADSLLGVVEYPVTAINAFGSTSAMLRIHVMAEVTIDGDDGRTAHQGEPITDWIPTVGGDGDIALSIDDLAGLEDLGLEFDDETGAITGTLNVDAPVGDHEFEVTATGLQNVASTSITITVEPRAVSLDLTRLGGSTVLQGGSVTVEVEVTDSLGNSTPVPASDLLVTSSVDTDEVDVEDGEFTVTFPHASPHTITVTQVSTGLTADITIEVTAVDDLSDTGIEPALPLGVATALVLLGVMLLVGRKRA